MALNYILDGCPWHYTCATRSSLPADRIHTETSGSFAFTWHWCEISYRSEILAPVQEPGWIHAGVTRAGMTFCTSEKLENILDEKLCPISDLSEQLKLPGEALESIFSLITKYENILVTLLQLEIYKTALVEENASLT